MHSSFQYLQDVENMRAARKPQESHTGDVGRMIVKVFDLDIINIANTNQLQQNLSNTHPESEEISVKRQTILSDHVVLY